MNSLWMKSNTGVTAIFKFLWRRHAVWETFAWEKTSYGRDGCRSLQRLQAFGRGVIQCLCNSLFPNTWSFMCDRCGSTMYLELILLHSYCTSSVSHTCLAVLILTTDCTSFYQSAFVVYCYSLFSVLPQISSCCVL